MVLHPTNKIFLHKLITYKNFVDYLYCSSWSADLNLSRVYNIGMRLPFGQHISNMKWPWNIFSIILNVWLFLVTWLKALLFRYQWLSVCKLLITTSHISFGVLKFECLVLYIIGESISCLMTKSFMSLYIHLVNIHLTFSTFVLKMTKFMAIVVVT